MEQRCSDFNFYSIFGFLICYDVFGILYFSTSFGFLGSRDNSRQAQGLGKDKLVVKPNGCNSMALI